VCGSIRSRSNKAMLFWGLALVEMFLVQQYIDHYIWIVQAEVCGRYSE
jgi:hypothetical protein